MTFVQQAFDSNWIAPAGPLLGAFENAIAKYSGMHYCAALSSGTAAIQLGLIAFGVKPGDEVISSSFTFAGSCNPIVYLGGTPVFVDSEPGTWNMDPFLLEEAITDRIRKTGKKPKCIIVVDLYGMPARMDEINQIAARYEVPVLEDAAEALGSRYKGKPAGTLAPIGIYSFNGNKIITTSGGGALISNNQAFVDKARFLATQARDPEPHYEHTTIGYNFRLSNVCAGIGLGQMAVLEDRVGRRRANFEFYRDTLGKISGVSFQPEPAEFKSNRWLTAIKIQSTGGQDIRIDLIKHLEKHGIESRPLWKPMHLQPVYRDVPAYINGVSENLFRSGICLPSGSGLSSDQLEEITTRIHSFLVTKQGVD